MGAAVSGGPDSLALLLLANAVLPGRVIAATIDHGLRPESAQEAAFASAVCGRLGIDHEVVRVAVTPGNVQDRARAARYDALFRSFGSRGCDVVATAHHADDQAETVLMRLARGSGLAGLAGIRERRVEIAGEPPGEFLLLRPLLHWRRAELADVIARAGIDPVRDPSNADARFDRVRIRAQLAALPDLDPLAIARSADLLQQAEAVVETAVARAIEASVHREGGRTWFHFGHPRMIEVEAVTAILRDLGADAPRSAVARLIDQLNGDGHATLAGIMVRRAWHRTGERSEVDAWLFEREPPRRG
ncbi:tRNA lysidine(34) synthetase TilS [Tsuneonella sp. YG55]|uniref:tRNA(Ile)-lysidine synthase n=1 Tax=Tsuneonella litorea TaxID=2976475 RepID=A0A9X3ANB5_9SPHN|nr:tRNA lysidine(34) synthetase TilS [Tsuneonella litorea]MCT2559487.1 tRNA lysidine(34) synthetase TilS [Tsuneonella litorea]